MNDICARRSVSRVLTKLAVITAATLFASIDFESVAAQDARKPMTLSELRQERQKLAHRQRRIIFNNDGDDVVYECKKATPEALLACRTTPLLGSQVDSISYCTWCSGYSYFTHRTKLGQIFDLTANPDHPDNKTGGLSRNKMAEFVKQGTDPLQIMVDFCHTNRLEILWSFRMNDTHDAWGSWYGDLLFPKLKQDHPEWLVASKTQRSKHGGWSAMDFGHAEVRDLTVKFIEEVCLNYDVDGIEMDFCRHPLYFKGPAWGQDAGVEELEQMTEMVRRVRDLTEQIGLKRGRPILVAVRVPDSAEYCKAMGLDVERWLKDGLFDQLGVSDYFRLNEWQVSVQLGHRYGVPVYASLSESRMKDAEAKKVRDSIECYRARAMNVWDEGADGVYIFNLFNPRHPVWRELGEPKKLETRDKVYVIGARGVAVLNRWMAGGEKRFMKRPTLSPERPVKLKASEPYAVDLRVGEDVRPKSGLTPQATLRVRVKDLADVADPCTLR
eukprot:TRINITY_DN8418_c0_g1_i2.p1 TRINITY_DN8418_c0_g1~~TRINITY_DN8418_c0_g1_i2.p1  ORF type:complete len:499 (+),score=6.94 TRINITY_DN8418_c0_g1_i2:403-1899(+)